MTANMIVDAINKDGECEVQATLDAFWSQTGSTVNGQSTLVQKGIALSKLVGLEPLYLEPGPLPAFDRFVAMGWPSNCCRNQEKPGSSIPLINNGTLFV